MPRRLCEAQPSWTQRLSCWACHVLALRYWWLGSCLAQNFCFFGGGMSSTHDYIIPCLGVYPIEKKNNWGWTFGFSTLSLHIYALMSCLSKSLFDALIYGIKRDSRLWDTHLLQVATNFLHGDTVFWGFGTGPSRRKASWDFFTSFLLANSILKFGNAWAKNWVASKYSLTFVVSKSRAPRILAFVAKKSWCFCKTVRSFSPRVRFLDGYFSISHRIYMVTFTIDIPPLC